VADYSAVVAAFQSRQRIPKDWAELRGLNSNLGCPDYEGGGVNFNDINTGVAGFQGGTYTNGPPPGNVPNGNCLPQNCWMGACLNCP